MNTHRARVIALIAIIFPLAAGVLLGAAVQPAHADTIAAPAGAAPSCGLTTDDLATVTAAQEQGLLPELAARRALLAKTITCAKTDAQALQANLNALNVGDGAVALQSQLSGKLDDAITYYNLELGKANSAGIAGTEQVAKEVLAWRAGTYAPLAAQVANFTLWSQNQALFSTGAARLQSMESAVNFVEQAAPNNELQSDLADAQSLMHAATNENEQATNALLAGAPSDQSLALIQQSLQSLSDAYQKFFDMSTILQSLLSTNPQADSQ